MLRQAINNEINRIGEIEAYLTEITESFKRLQTIEMINFRRETRELENIKEKINDLRLDLFEMLLDLPNSENSESSDDDE